MTYIYIMSYLCGNAKTLDGHADAIGKIFKTHNLE